MEAVGLLVVAVFILGVVGYALGQVGSGIKRGMASEVEPGAVENLVAGSRARASAYRDRAEVEAIAARLEIATLRAALHKAEANSHRDS